MCADVRRTGERPSRLSRLVVSQSKSIYSSVIWCCFSVASGHVIDSLGFLLRSSVCSVNSEIRQNIEEDSFQSVNFCLPFHLSVEKEAESSLGFTSLTRSSKTVGGVMYLKSCAEGIKLSQSEVTFCLSNQVSFVCLFLFK